MFANFLRLAAIIGALPVTLTNGTTADASQVMQDLNFIVSQVNANAASGANIALINANNNFSVVQSGVNASQPANFVTASQVQNSALTSLSSTLGTNTITASNSALPLTGYAVGQVFTFIPSNANTPGTVTLNINGIGALNVAAMGTNTLGMELSAGVPISAEYDGSKLNLMSRQPGLVLLDRKVLGLSSSCDLINGINSSFDEYLITISQAIPVNDNNSMWFRVATSGVPGAYNFESGAGSYSHSRISNQTNSLTLVGNGVVNDDHITLNQNASAGVGLNGELKYFNPSKAGGFQSAIWALNHLTAGGAQSAFVTGGGMYNNGLNVLAFRLMMGSGQLNGGTFALYGLRKS